MRRTVAATLFAAPALVLSACSPPGEVPSDSPGTQPPVWTGSPAPTTEAGGHGAGHGAAAAAGDTLSADIRNADGVTVATADIAFTDGFATVTVETTGQGRLTPGFHGLHIHSVGKCETDSVSPTGGAPGNFNSAGGHLHTSRDNEGHPAAGDLSALQIRSDGEGKLVTTTDAFTAEDLLADGGAAIMIHEKPDNYANIPPERYQQINGDPPPDQTTLDTGDAGARVACGVIGRG
ncbi:superoxide dismutase family protein [Mycobacterium sp. pV006]|uniref:superoxide dismutase[Cu-Zn] n=1 Tax=Mycobacterium sp. pV006 TaxID=3238983 RepID=UPI00351AE6B8